MADRIHHVAFLPLIDRRGGVMNQIRTAMTKLALATALVALGAITTSAQTVWRPEDFGSRDDRTRFYGPTGDYLGSRDRNTSDGSTRYFNSTGDYQGRATREGPNTNFYGPTGDYQGRMVRPTR
jgi:hypothetical protein